jgi:hypothetical protein
MRGEIMIVMMMMGFLLLLLLRIWIQLLILLRIETRKTTHLIPDGFPKPAMQSRAGSSHLPILKQQTNRFDSIRLDSLIIN